MKEAKFEIVQRIKYTFTCPYCFKANVKSCIRFPFKFMECDYCGQLSKVKEE